MKKTISLFLALALCLSLSVPASASGSSIYIYDPYGEELSVSEVKGLNAEGDVTTLNGVSGVDLTLGESPTIVLAPGSKNTLLSLVGGDVDDVNNITIRGTGELILYNPRQDDSRQDYGVFWGLITSLKLEDGLVMTGGAKEGDSAPLSIQAVEKNPVNGFVTYSCCTADKVPARYVRIAPKAAEKPAEPQKPAAPSSTGFSDVPDSHYAAAAIKDCVAKGVTSGYADGTFRPAAPVTRAQFCVMIARAFYSDDLKLHETAENKAKGWFVPAADCLYLMGVNGGLLESASFEEKYDDPAVMNQPISRYDMAQIAANTLMYNHVNVSTDMFDPPLGIADRDVILSSNYKMGVAICYHLGILGGQSDGTFGGNNPMNRAQGCVVIQRITQRIAAGAPAGTPEEPPAPAETPAETPVPSGGDLTSMRQGVLELVNAERSKAGKSPLTLNSALCDVAQLRADEIVNTFSHTRPDGTVCFTALNQAGISYRTCGENIAAGQGTPASVMDSWMNSEGHRANILNGDFSSIGIGYVKAPSGYGHYWVQMFIG